MAAAAATDDRGQKKIAGTLIVAGVGGECRVGEESGGWPNIVFIRRHYPLLFIILLFATRFSFIYQKPL